MFEMRVYDGDFTVGRLIEDCSVSRRHSELPVEGHEPAPEIDLAKLNRRLAELPVAEIRRRRARMNIFYEEVLVSSDPDKGIAFNALLMILAHYKVINDNKSLRYEHDSISGCCRTRLTNFLSGWKNSCGVEHACSVSRKLSGETSLWASSTHCTGRAYSAGLWITRVRDA